MPHRGPRDSASLPQPRGLHGHPGAVLDLPKHLRRPTWPAASGVCGFGPGNGSGTPPLLLVLTRLRSTLALQYQPGSNRPLRPSPPSHFTKIAQATAPHRGRRLRRRSEARCPLLLSLRGTVLSTSISLPALHYPSLPYAPPTRPSHPPCGRPQSFNTSRTYPCRQYSTSCI